MKMSELILAVGDENVKIQNLFDGMKSASTNKRGITTISFGTQAVSANDLIEPSRSPLIGLVLWLPRDKVDAAIAAAKAAAPAMTYEQALKVVEGMTVNDLAALADDDPRLPEINEACAVFLKDIERRRAS